MKKAFNHKRKDRNGTNLHVTIQLAAFPDNFWKYRPHSYSMRSNGTGVYSSSSPVPSPGGWTRSRRTTGDTALQHKRQAQHGVCLNLSPSKKEQSSRSRDRGVGVWIWEVFVQGFQWKLSSQSGPAVRSVSRKGGVGAAAESTVRFQYHWAGLKLTLAKINTTLIFLILRLTIFQYFL
jgi:hypothetical protein